jgi:glycosyltransferase involved in cell wall biosynthesis
MKKVLHIIDSMGIGGAERLVVTVINSLVGRYEQHLILLNKPDTLLPEIDPSCKVTIIGVSFPRGLWTARGKVKSYIREHHIDIVHTQLYWSSIVARLASPRHVKVFNTLQAIMSASVYNGRWLLYIEKFTYKKHHHIIGVSQEVLKDFDEWVGIKGKSTVLYNIIEDKFFETGPKTSFSTEELKLVAVGNLREQKNYPYILEAFKQMPKNVSLDIYGEGTLREQLQATIDKFDLNVRLCGHHQQVQQVLPHYDMVLMCSFYEGFSLGLMEAMACGLPPILSKVPVMEEAGGDIALYVNIDDPSDLVRKVQQVLDGGVDLVSLSQKAYARSKAMSWGKTHIDKLTALYD